MKKIKFLLLLLIIIYFNSCTQHLVDNKGIITRIEYSDKDGIYNIYLKSVDGILLCYGPFETVGRVFFFETKNLSYHVGDTVKFLSNEND